MKILPSTCETIYEATIMLPKNYKQGFIKHNFGEKVVNDMNCYSVKGMNWLKIGGSYFNHLWTFDLESLINKFTELPSAVLILNVDTTQYTCYVGQLKETIQSCETVK